MKIIFINLVLLFLTLSLSVANGTPTGDVNVYTIPTDPILDGVIDSDWSGVTSDTITMNRLSGSGPVSFDVDVYLCHTATKLYIGLTFYIATPNSGDWMGLYIDIDNDLNWDNNDNLYDFPVMNGIFAGYDQFHNTTGDYFDFNSGGSSSVLGDGTLNSGTYVFELSQDLNNADSYDISLSNGISTYYAIRSSIANWGFYQSAIFTMTISATTVSEIPQQLLIGALIIPLIAIIYFQKK